jgi:hypothetical protein
MASMRRMLAWNAPAEGSFAEATASLQLGQARAAGAPARRAAAAAAARAGRRRAITVPS